MSGSWICVSSRHHTIVHNMFLYASVVFTHKRPTGGCFFLDLSGPGCTLHSLDVIASVYLLQSGHWAGALLEPRKHLKERKRKCFDQLLRNIFYNISDTVAHLLVLSSPGTTLVPLLFPFTSVLRCRGAK